MSLFNFFYRRLRDYHTYQAVQTLGTAAGGGGSQQGIWHFSNCWGSFWSNCPFDMSVLTLERMGNLSSVSKTEMKQAIEHVNLVQINALIEQIREQDGALAGAIQ